MMARVPEFLGTTTSTSVSGSLLKRGARIARSLVARKCIQTETLDTCEKPAASANTVIGVLIGVGYVCLTWALMVHLRLVFCISGNLGPKY